MNDRVVLLSAALLLVCGCDSGSSPVAPSGATLTLRASPSAITGSGSSTLEALATEGGLPVRTGTEIRFTTDLGRIVQEVVRTDGDGLARTTLEADGRLGTATVTATSGVQSATASVTIGDSSLAASFSCNGSDLTVIFTDTSSGGPNSWSWDFGDQTGTSTDKDPTYTYGEAGTYVVTLTVTNSGGSDSGSQFVTVPGTGSGVCS